MKNPSRRNGKKNIKRREERQRKEGERQKEVNKDNTQRSDDISLAEVTYNSELLEMFNGQLCPSARHKGIWGELKETFTNYINPLNTKRRLLYLKTQFVPRSKHFSSQL